MNIILTGSSGFVGKNLAIYLENKGNKCLPLSLRNDDWKDRVPFNGDAIIHLAGKAHDTSNVSDASEYFHVNRDLTISLFQKFLESDIRDFFYFSSVKAVADTVKGELTENHERKPQTPYGKSKLEAENYLLSCQIPSNKRLFIIRPCMIHGPNNKGNLNLLYRVVKLGFPWPLGAFENKRSYLGIDNLCYLIGCMLTRSDLRSGVFNFADDTPLSTNRLVNLIGQCVDQRATILKIPIKIIQTLVKIGDVVPLPINSERLKKLTESYVVSNVKIKNALHIDQLPSLTEDGLKKTILSFEK